MAEASSQDMNARMEQLNRPVQRLGAFMVDNLERTIDLQLGMFRSCTQYTVKQWREVLAVRDPQGFQEYLQQQGEAAQALSQELSEDIRKFVGIGQDMATQAMRLGQRMQEDAVDAVGAAASRMERETDRAAGQAQRAARRA